MRTLESQSISKRIVLSGKWFKLWSNLMRMLLLVTQDQHCFSGMQRECTQEYLLAIGGKWLLSEYVELGTCLYKSAKM